MIRNDYFSISINQVLAAYMYAKKKYFDLSVATTFSESYFIMEEFKKYLQIQGVKVIFFEESYQINDNYYCETQNNYIIPNDINNIEYFVTKVLSLVATSSSKILWDAVKNGFFSSICIKWRKKQLEADMVVVDNLEKKYNQIFDGNTVMEKKLTNN